MGSLLNQISAVVRMSISSLPQRLWMSLATLIAVAIVVAVLLAFLAMGNGFKQTVANSGSEDIAIVLRKGSQAEINSVLSRDQVKIIEEAPGVAKDEAGPIVSSELYVVVDGVKRSTQNDANLPLRGVSSRGPELRETFTIIEGRMFEAGKNEIIVGRSVLSEFAGFDLGDEVKFGQTTWKVVGVFDVAGSVFASELWTDARVLQNQFNRGSSYQIMRVQLNSPDAVSELEAFIAKDPRLNLEVKSEKDYYAEQASMTSDMIFYLGWPLAIAMALGALAGALNTMYTSVAQRSTEIATLRAIGFSSVASFTGTLFESLVLSVVGGVLGTLAAFIFFDGMTGSTLGGSFTQIVFDFNISADAMMNGITIAIIIGLVGGFFPAYRASRLPVILAFATQK